MIGKRVAEKRGFTLAEALVATLILLMASSIMVAGIPAAKNAYEKVVIKSNAEMLMSNAINALRNEMSVAEDVRIDEEGKTVTYLNGTYGSYSKISLDDSKGIMYQRFAYSPDIEEAEGAEKPDDRQLISEYASDKQNNLIVKYDKITKPKEGIVTFEGLEVDKANGDEVLSPRNISIDTF